ncbi:YadA-like family protein [Ochrobactrum sp. Marseille-Q0166]|uniref:YadA-like family protein n=1 Tax=Ochrobactrum sp. Marseille-Q0166 TaxID=2761105 RepID=UPI001654FC66|nr:YadA-like family protein [Ochrobactrum sp. Marseille-Q0166]MBC8718334.1 YadA-like family protein [Ochrobactrum sp. Marseille-Q0166]
MNFNFNKKKYFIRNVFLLSSCSISCFLIHPVFAQTTDLGSKVGQVTTDCIGKADPQDDDDDNSLAEGNKAKAAGTGATAIGACSDAKEQGATALGYNATASALNSTALGEHSSATAENAIGIGPNSVGSGLNAIAIGANATASKTGSMALGANAVSEYDGSLALGADSVTSAVVATKDTTIGGDTYTFAGRVPTSTVSVGSSEGERHFQRTITNVAAGRISQDSMDAVNGSQLLATNQAVNKISDGYKSFGNSVSSIVGGGSEFNSDGVFTDPTYNIRGKDYHNIGDGFKAVDNGLEDLNTKITNINNGGGIKYFHANSSLSDSDAIGSESLAIGGGAVARGVNSQALGKNATAIMDNAIALGAETQADSNEGDVAIGAGSKTSKVVATKGTTLGNEYYDYAGSNPVSAVSFGSAGFERILQNVAAGRLDTESTDAVNGSQLFATNQSLDRTIKRVDDLDQKIHSIPEQPSPNVVQYDPGLDGKPENSVTFHGGDPNAPVVLHNVASGTRDSDASNMKQLRDVASAAHTYTDTKSEETYKRSTEYTDNKVGEVIGQSNKYTDEQISKLTGHIDDVSKEAKQAAAIGLAASSLRYDDRPGKVSAAVGGGAWGGQGAFALGLGYTAESQRVRLNVSAASSGGRWGVGAGASFTFN